MIFLVTGGASGLGEAITRKIAQNDGYTVYFTYSRSVDSAKKIEHDFKNAIAIKCDFKNDAEVEALKNQIATLNIDGLINNAYTGEAIKTYFHKIPQQDFLADFKDNIIPTIAITQAAINNFRKKKFGKVITVLTSFLINTPPTGASVYVANKAYLEQLTKVWAAENAKYNITSNTVSPAFMLTNFTNDTDERVIEQMIVDHPLKKILTVDEVADVVVFLTQSTQQINGVDLIINSAVNIK
jgi:3-oxoacyl-[acyl-carrier protein] reductase